MLEVLQGNLQIPSAASAKGALVYLCQVGAHASHIICLVNTPHELRPEPALESYFHALYHPA